MTTHRERVLTALRHEEPDRVPLDLGEQSDRVDRLLHQLHSSVELQPGQPSAFARPPAGFIPQASYGAMARS